jgi:hypothetical protein
VAVLTEEWHKNRFQLFTDFCFPSVSAQTNKDFEWLVFFDTTTPETYKQHIKILESQLSNFRPFFADGMDQFLPILKSHISKVDSPYIITSGLDNDDCLSKHYIKKVQNQFDQQEFMAVDFIDGYTLQISPNYKLGKKLHLYNPFISLIEKNNDPKTVCNVSHRLWKKEKRIVQIKNHPIWSSVIHEENKVNEFTGFGNVKVDSFLSDFKLSTEAANNIHSRLIPSNQWMVSNVTNAISSHWNVMFKNFKKNLGLYK